MNEDMNKFNSLISKLKEDLPNEVASAVMTVEQLFE